MGLKPGFSAPKRRGAKKRHSSEQVLVHTCHDQSRERQPEHCACSDRISDSAARRLIRNGLAQWLFFERCGKLLPNRKSLVLTPEAAERQAHTQDALNHKLALSITSFSDSTPAPERMQSGIDRAIEATRIFTCNEHVAHLKKRRKHRVRWANTRKGAGGLTVGVFGEVVDLTLKGENSSKGNGPDPYEKYDPNEKPETYSQPGIADKRFREHASDRRFKPKTIWEIVGAEEKQDFKDEHGHITFFQSPEDK